MNPMMIMQMKTLLERFQRNHPRVPMFLADAGQSLGEGSIIEINVTTEEGKNLCTNLKVTEEDMELIRQLRTMMPQGRV